MAKKKESCAQCGGTVSARTVTVKVRVGAHTVDDGSLRAPVCDQCGSYVMSQAELEESERRAALVALKDIEGPSGAVLRFARKALGLRQAELAIALDTTAETVCRWEASDHIERRVALSMAQLLTLHSTDPASLALLLEPDGGPRQSEPAPAKKRRMA